MSEKQVVEITQRENDIFEIMLAKSEEVLGSVIKRVCFPPAQIMAQLKAKYPEIKIFHIPSSQKKLEDVGLVRRIPDTGSGQTVGSKRPPSTFEIKMDLYENCEIVIIKKRKTGYKPGTFKKPPVTLDKTKTTIKKAKQLLEKKKVELERLNKKGLKMRQALACHDAEVNDLREIIQVVGDLLAVKRKNLKNLGLLPE